MIRIIICDDDADMLNQIKETAEHVLMQLNVRAIINTYTNHHKISSQLLQSCDLALLDIDFGSDGYNGMDLARRFRECRTDSIIIFITNFIEYAPEGYEVQAFRYILKNDLKRGLQQAIPEALRKFALEKEIIKIQINGEIIDLPICQIPYRMIGITPCLDSLTSIERVKMPSVPPSMSWKPKDMSFTVKRPMQVESSETMSTPFISDR